MGMAETILQDFNRLAGVRKVEINEDQLAGLRARIRQTFEANGRLRVMVTDTLAEQLAVIARANGMNVLVETPEGVQRLARVGAEVLAEMMGNMIQKRRGMSGVHAVVDLGESTTTPRKFDKDRLKTILTKSIAQIEDEISYKDNEDSITLRIGGDDVEVKMETSDDGKQLKVVLAADGEKHEGTLEAAESDDRLAQRLAAALVRVVDEEEPDEDDDDDDAGDDAGDDADDDGDDED